VLSYFPARLSQKRLEEFTPEMHFQRQSQQNGFMFARQTRELKLKLRGASIREILSLNHNLQSGYTDEMLNPMLSQRNGYTDEMLNLMLSQRNGYTEPLFHALGESPFIIVLLETVALLSSL
jgi:hypothetical protein